MTFAGKDINPRSMRRRNIEVLYPTLLLYHGRSVFALLRFRVC